MSSSIEHNGVSLPSGMVSTISLMPILDEDPHNDSDAHVCSMAHRVGALLRSEVPSSWLSKESGKIDHALVGIVTDMERFGSDPVSHGKSIDRFNELLVDLYAWAENKQVLIHA
ncbi:hypothetical protein ACI2KR_31410 [Pseudomonas luteola]